MDTVAPTAAGKAPERLASVAAEPPRAALAGRHGPRALVESDAMPIKLTVNGKATMVEAPADMPLLWVIRDVLNLKGTKYGCGMSVCGMCTVHVDGEATRSCVTPVSTVV